MATGPVRRCGDDVELDAQSYKLRRAGRVLKLERTPLEVLFLLIEHSEVRATTWLGGPVSFA